MINSWIEKIITFIIITLESDSLLLQFFVPLKVSINTSENVPLTT